MTKSRAGSVSMQDVADRAGVSLATASRALSGSSGVSNATRDRVRRVADELSYVVSPEASALSRGKTDRVGVLVPNPARWFFGEALEGIGAVLTAAGLDMLVYPVPAVDDRRRFFTHLPARRKVDAVLVTGIPVTREEQERLATLGVAIVASGGQFASYPHVSIDDESAARQAMDHLRMLGHRRIAMVDAIDPHAAEWPVAGRARAYASGLAEMGEPLRPELFVRVPWGPGPAARAMESLLSLRTPPTAVLAHSDEMAIGALGAIRRAGLRVPTDISVIGVDDHPLSEHLDLTTIHQDVRRQGELAASLVLRILAGEGADPEPVLLPTRLVPRGSTGPPRPLG